MFWEYIDFRREILIEFQICVGFVGGRFSDNEYFILPIGDVEHIGNQAKEIAKDFEDFVKESGGRF